MAQFGKNPPWARNDPAAQQSNIAASALQNMAVAAAVGQQVGLAQPGAVLTQPGLATPTVYSLGGPTASLGTQHQYSATQLNVVQGLQQAVQLPQPGIALPTTLSTNQHAVNTVSYPAPRGPGGPVPGPNPQPQQQQQQQQQQQHKQRVFTGTVTKLHDNFGFVDEDVFFQISCVKGPLPKVGDRVLVEATYNMNMPFKWNATRIQLLPNQAPPAAQAPGIMGSGSGARGPMAAGNAVPQQANVAQPPPLMGQQATPTPSLLPGNQHRQQNQNRSTGNERSGFRDRDRDRMRDRDRDRHERRDRRSPPARKRSRSPRRSRSPSVRTRSSPPRRRTQRPQPRYQVTIPKFTLDMKEAHVTMLKSRYINLYIPSDFFHTSLRWTECFPLHRPFKLPSQSCTYHVMHKEVDPVDTGDVTLEPADADYLYSAKVMLISTPTTAELYHKCCGLAEEATEQEGFVHPTRLLHFLVGLKGKSEPMAIGGPWSPSIDGSNPATDPRVLINTAIRTTRALTGIDLSSCTKWYRFAEIRYHRPEEVHKGRLVPPRVETVVIFLPDVWTCQPSQLDWESLQGAYKKQLAGKIQEENKEDADAQEDEDGDGDEVAGEKTDPTHFSELDPKNMKVADLRKELESRTLSSKGLKSQLIARLTKAVKSEQEKEEEEAEHKEEQVRLEEEKKNEEKMEVDEKEDEKKRKEDEEKRRRDERDAASREKRYTLPDTPSILVHPSSTAKGGKFDCSVMSLSVLLDYRQEDNKEHSFEVSLFAELFNEMLMRDFGFLIYKSLLSVPEKKEDEKKHKKDEKREDKDEKDRDKKEEEKEQPSKKQRTEQDHDKDDRDKKDKKQDKDKGSDDDDDGDDRDDDDKDKDRDKDRGERRHSRDKDSRKREKTKFHTWDPALLLAFVYFDTTHSGYLLDKDAEDLLQMIGLNLSRSQVKKLVKKVVSRDTFNYRKLTDKAISSSDDSGDGEKKEGDSAEDKEMTDGGDDEGLAKGNMVLMESQTEKEKPLTESTPSGPTEGMVLYDGAMLDIKSFMQRLEKSEKTRSATEAKLKDLNEEMDMLKTSFSSSEQNGQKVALELQELKKKLRDQRKATETAESSSSRYNKALTEARSALSTVLTDVTAVLEVKDERLEVKREVNGD